MMVMTAGIFVAGIVFVIARSVAQMALQPGSKAMEKAVKRLRDRLRDHLGRLVPWESDTLALLSLNRTDLTKPGFFGGDHTGVFTTIYHEPVLAYAQQRSGKNSLVVAQTSHHEFIYRIREKETDIVLNGQPLGTFINDRLLGPGKTPRLLAQLEADPAEAQFPLNLGNQTAATLANPARLQSPNPRALMLLRPLSPEEENVALALAVLQVVRGER
jgi:hypothetical protein